MMYCHQCGNKVSEDSKFCHRCGMSIDNKNEHISYMNKIGKGILIFVGLCIFGGVVFLYGGNISTNKIDEELVSTSGSKIFYVQSDNTRVRKCPSLSCDVLGYYSANDKIELPYNSFSELPEWIQFNFIDNKDTPTIGYIKSSTIGESEIQTIKPVVTDFSTSKKNDLPSLVKEWSPITPFLSCNFRDSNGIIQLSQSGSGVLIRLKNGFYYVMTNNHVIKNSNYYANDCSIYFSGVNSPFIVLNSNMEPHPNGKDVVLLKINNSDSYLESLVNTNGRNFCLSTPNIGDSVIVLGYPSIGSLTGITVTDGIISGIEDDFYVTSAKVDHGNSGGVAVDVERNCYLGIPTYVISGKLESLARILKWSSIVTNPEDFKNRAPSARL